MVSLGLPDIWFFDLTNPESGKVRIGYTTYGDYRPRSIALNVTLGNGATVAGPSAVDSKSDDFKCFIDFVHDDPEGYTFETGHPLAYASSPGALTASAAQFSINAAVLNSGNAGPATCTDLVTLLLTPGTGNATVTVDLDTLRNSFESRGVKVRVPPPQEIEF